jgi:hypothetical protein
MDGDDGISQYEVTKEEQRELVANCKGVKKLENTKTHERDYEKDDINDDVTENKEPKEDVIEDVQEVKEDIQTKAEIDGNNSPNKQSKHTEKNTREESKQVPIDSRTYHIQEESKSPTVGKGNIEEKQEPLTVYCV